MMIEDWLIDLGYEVAGPHAHVPEARKVARRETPAAAMLDVHLDCQRVFGVAEVLAVRGILFVFATGYGAAPLSAPWANRPFLAKPFSQHELERMLGRLVGR